MSTYTEAASRPGIKGASGTDDRQLFLIEFGQMVIEAYDEVMNFMNLRWTKQITQGKADSFPIIGRKRDATEHTPGEIILGGKITHDEIQISLDQMLVDAAFIPEIDALMAHYELSAPYAKQIGQSLGSTTDKRIAIMHVLSSRWNAVTGNAVPQGQPVPIQYIDASLRTSATSLETFAFKAVQFLEENDMSGEKPAYMLPWQQYLLAARTLGVTAQRTAGGAGDASTAVMGLIAGLQPQGTNHIPKTNITTGLAKYQGDFSNTVGIIASRMGVGTLERRGLKMVMKEQDDRLGTLIIGSKFDGHGNLRPECSIEGAVA